MHKIFISIAILASFIIPQTSLAGTCKIGDSDLRNWEFSTGASFSGSQGTTDKTDIGVRACYEFDDKENRVTSTGKYAFGKTDGITNEELWRADLSYLRRIQSFASETTSLFFNLSSFVERDEINLLSLRSGLGGGLSADFPLFLSIKAHSSVLVFWEREDRDSAPTKDFASLHFGARLEKETKNLKMSLFSVFVLPPADTDDFRSETEAALSVPLSETIALQLTAGLDYENEPVNSSLEKTNFRYTTSLNFVL